MIYISCNEKVGSNVTHFGVLDAITRYLVYLNSIDLFHFYTNYLKKAKIP